MSDNEMKPTRPVDLFEGDAKHDSREASMPGWAVTLYDRVKALEAKAQVRENTNVSWNSMRERWATEIREVASRLTIGAGSDIGDYSINSITSGLLNLANQLRDVADDINGDEDCPF